MSCFVLIMTCKFSVFIPTAKKKVKIFFFSPHQHLSNCFNLHWVFPATSQLIARPKICQEFQNLLLPTPCLTLQYQVVILESPDMSMWVGRTEKNVQFPTLSLALPGWGKQSPELNLCRVIKDPWCLSFEATLFTHPRLCCLPLRCFISELVSLEKQEKEKQDKPQGHRDKNPKQKGP